MCEVGYNANHIEDEGSDNDEGDSDGYVSAGMRGFTLCLCVGVAGVVRGGGYNANHIEYGLVIIMMMVIVMAMLHSVVVCEVVYNANHIEDVGSDNDECDSDVYLCKCWAEGLHSVIVCRGDHNAAEQESHNPTQKTSSLFP